MTTTNPTIAKLPLWLRKFVVDAIEGSVASGLALTFAFPTTVPQTETIAAAVVIGASHALVSAARREAPDFGGWLAGVFGTGS